MFKNNTVRKGVMKVIEERIAEAQRSYEASLESLKLKHEEEIARLKEEQIAAERGLADEHILKVVGKIL